MTVAIIDYGSGNLRSAAKAFERAARDAKITEEIVVTSHTDDVLRADRIVLPGVGAFGDCKAGLAALDGMVAALTEAVRIKGRPFLGICVGMQLLATSGLEHGKHEGLGWIPGKVQRLNPSGPSLKIPHMGWNELTFASAVHPALEGLKGVRSDVYFVHSYGFQAEDGDDVLATTDYGGPVTAIVGRDNVMGTQFHPEKSQAAGLRFISDFLKWRP